MRDILEYIVRKVKENRKKLIIGVLLVVASLLVGCAVAIISNSPMLITNEEAGSNTRFELTSDEKEGTTIDFSKRESDESLREPEFEQKNGTDNKYAVQVASESNKSETGTTEVGVAVNLSTKELAEASEIGRAIEQTLFEGNDMTTSGLSGSNASVGAEEVLKQLEKEVAQAQQLSNTTINVTSAVEKLESDNAEASKTEAPKGVPPEVTEEYDINGNVIGKLPSPPSPSSSLSPSDSGASLSLDESNNSSSSLDSKEIFYDNGIAYVKVGDVDIDYNNKIYISYKGYGYYLDGSLYARTPSKLQNKEAYDLEYVGTTKSESEKGKPAYNVAFRNRVDNKVVTVKLIKGLTGFKSYQLLGL